MCKHMNELHSARCSPWETWRQVALDFYANILDINSSSGTDVISVSRRKVQTSQGANFRGKRVAHACNEVQVVQDPRSIGVSVLQVHVDQSMSNIEACVSVN